MLSTLTNALKSGYFPHEESPEESSRQFRFLLIGLGLITLARLALAATLPLTEDEAYYRLWAQHLQLGYYDHPPVIAWWVKAGLVLAGDTELGVRLIPSISASMLSLVLYAVARALNADTRLARRAAWWLQGALLVAVGGLVATPDSPSVLFWSLTLWFAIKARDQASLKWWALAGLTAGLATLSKYSALFLGPGMLAWLLIDAKGRKQLTTPGPWLAAIVAVAVFSTNVAWNATHDWVTFNKQFGRVTPDELDVGNLGDFIVAFIGLLNPFIALALIVALFRKPAAQEDGSTRDILLLTASTTLPFLIYLLAHALHSSVQAHWPAPLYPAIILSAAATLPRLPNLLETFTRAIILPFAAFAVVLISSWALFPKATGSNVAFPIQGWEQLSSDVADLAAQEEVGWIGVMGYASAAMYDNQSDTLDLPVVQLFERARYLPPHSSLTADTTQPGLVVDLSRRVHMSDMVLCFTSIEELPSMERSGPAGKSRSYTVYKVSGTTRDILKDGCWDGEPPSRRRD